MNEHLNAYVFVCPMQCNAVHWTECKPHVNVRPSGVCGQDCDVTHGPIFTKFGTLLSDTLQKKTFLAVRSEVVCAHARPLMDCHLQVSNV